MKAARFVLVCALLFSLIASVATNIAAEKSVVQVLLSGDQNYVNNIQTIFNAFEQKNPDIKVEVTMADWAAQKFRVMYAAGTPPDLVRMNETVEFGTAGMIDDLTPMIKADASFGFNDFFPPAIPALGWAGRVYAIPFGITVQAMFLNCNLFDNAGVPTTVNTWTWEKDALTYGKRLTRDVNGDGRIDQFFMNRLGGLDWLQFLYAAGEQLFSADGSRFTGNTAVGASALQFAADLWNVYHIAPNGVENETGNWDFTKGNMAMKYGGSWEVGKFRQMNLPFTWDTSNVPSYRGQSASYLWPETPWGIPSTAKNKEGAWRLLKFIASREGQEMVAKLGLAMPIRLSAARSSAFLEQRPPNNIIAFVEAAMLPRTGIEPSTPGWGDVWSVLESGLVNPVYDGLKAATQALNEVEAPVNTKLRDALATIRK